MATWNPQPPIPPERDGLKIRRIPYWVTLLPTSTVVNWHNLRGFWTNHQLRMSTREVLAAKPMVFTPQSCRMIDDWKTIETLALVNTPGPWMVWIPQPSLFNSTYHGCYVWLLRVCLGWLSTRAKAAVWESPRLWRFGTFPSPGLLERHQEGSKQQTLKNKGCFFLDSTSWICNYIEDI